MKDDQKGRKHKRQNGSGYAVAFFGLIRGGTDDAGLIWNRSHITALKKCKPNICKSKHAHFGSNGYYASFGNKADYKIVDHSSVSQYTSKKKTNKKVQTYIERDTRNLECLLARELDSATSSFQGIYAT